MVGELPVFSNRPPLSVPCLFVMAIPLVVSMLGIAASMARPLAANAPRGEIGIAVVFLLGTAGGGGGQLQLQLRIRADMVRAHAGGNSSV